MTDKLIIFDTTLRDGEQSPGASMTRDEKLRIARQLERLRVDVIEAGFAASSNGDFEAVRPSPTPSRTATVCSLARANDRDIARAAEALKGAARARIHTFIATSAAHGEEAAHDARPGARAGQAGGALRAQPVRRHRVLARGRLPLRPRLPVPRARGGDRRGRDHASTSPTPWAMRCPSCTASSSAAARAHPNSDKAVWSVHCHNDLGMAVANSLAGVKIGGARQVECTINGLGERAGNCSLEEVVMAVRRGATTSARRGHRHHADRAGLAHGQPDHRLRGAAEQGGGRRQRLRACLGHPPGRRAQGARHLRDHARRGRGLGANKIVLGKLSGATPSSSACRNWASSWSRGRGQRRLRALQGPGRPQERDLRRGHHRAGGDESVTSEQSTTGCCRCRSVRDRRAAARQRGLRGRRQEHHAESDGNGPVDASLKAIESKVQAAPSCCSIRSMPSPPAAQNRRAR
jgi:2-isopropylmalate synthase